MLPEPLKVAVARLIHAQHVEDAFFLKLVEGLSREDLDDAREDVIPPVTAFLRPA